MSQVLTPNIALPVQGTSINLPFSVAQRPDTGDWTVSVTLKRTTPDAGNAIIILQQSGIFIASKVVEPTLSAETYSMDVPGSLLGNIVSGICNNSNLSLLVFTDVSVSTGCCPDDPIPTVLVATMSCPTCPQIDGMSWEMVYFPGPGPDVWNCVSVPVNAQMYACVSGNWGIQFNFGSLVSGGYQLSFTIDCPNHIYTFSGVLMGSTICTDAAWTITVRGSL